MIPFVLLVCDRDLVRLLDVAIGAVSTFGGTQNALVAAVVPFGGQDSALAAIVSREDAASADADPGLSAAAAELVPVRLFPAAAVVARGAQLGDEGSERGQGHGDLGQTGFYGGPEEEVSCEDCRYLSVNPENCHNFSGGCGIETHRLCRRYCSGPGDKTS